MTHGIMIRRIGLLRLFGIEIFKLKKEKLHFSKHHGKVNWSNVWLMEYRHCVICACVSGVIFGFENIPSCILMRPEEI